MAFKIKVVEVNIEEVRNGKNKYDKASLVYSYNGENRTQPIVSFSNPEVFKTVRDMKVGEEYEVETTKNGQYTNWSKLTKVSGSTSARTSAAPKSGGTWETAEERAKKQLLIVKQSCLAQAVAFHGPQHSDGLAPGDILDTAQDFVDWVMNSNVDLFKQDNDLGDVPL